MIHGQVSKPVAIHIARGTRIAPSAKAIDWYGGLVGTPGSQNGPGAARCDISASNEIGELCAAFNNMIDKIGSKAILSK